MRFFILFISVLHVQFFFAQERVSEFQNQDDVIRYFAEEVDGKSYLVKVFESRLEVFFLNDDYSTTFLHSENNLRISNTFLLGNNDGLYYDFDPFENEPTIYNFVTDERISIEIPENINPFDWVSIGRRFALFREIVSNENDFMHIIDLENNEYVFNDAGQSILAIVGDNIIIEDEGLLFAEDINTGARVTLATEFEDVDLAANNRNEQFTFLNDAGHPVRYNILEEEFETFELLSFDPAEFTEFAWVDDFIITSNEDLFPKSIDIYSSLDGSIISVQDDYLFINFSLEFARIAENKLLLSLSDFVVVDLDSGMIRAFDTYTNFDSPYPLIDNRYFIADDFGRPSLYDLKDLTNIQGLDMPLDIFNGIDYNNIVPVGNDFLGVFNPSGGFVNAESIFRISIENLTVSHDSAIEPFEGDGFFAPTTELVQVDDEILIESEDLYIVEEDGIIQLNSNRLLSTNQVSSLNNNTDFSFITGDDNNWYVQLLDNNELTDVATIEIPSELSLSSPAIAEFQITEENVFYIVESKLEEENSLWRFERGSNTSQFVSDLDNGNFAIPNRFLSNGTDTYYLFNSGLYYVDAVGESNLLLDFSDQSPANFIRLENNLYFFTNENLYALEDDNLVLLFESNESNSDFSFASQNNRSLFFNLTSNAGHSVIRVSDNTINRLDLGQIESAVQFTSANDFMIISEADLIDPELIYVFNELDNSFYDLSDLDLQGAPLNIHFYNQKAYLIMERSLNLQVFIYRLESNFSAANLIDQYFAESFFNLANSRFVDQQGLFYVNDDFFVVEEGYNLTSLDITGSGDSQLVVRDEFVYFFANDPEFNNQVFRFQLQDPTSTFNPVKVESFNVSPNPASELINIDLQVEGKFTIVNSLGQIMSQGTMVDSTVDISNLIEGIYFIKSENKDKIFISTFVKAE